MLSEIVGIFLGEQQLHYAFLKRELNKWSRIQAPFFSDMSGRTSVERLGSLLGQLKPQRGRRICIGLPRNRYYLRDLKFTGLSLEEAENAVRLSISSHVHLPLEEVYFDCWPYEKNGHSHVLVAYAKRGLIDSIFEQVERTGHKKSLYCISPSGLGSDILLRRGTDVSFPCLSLQEEDGQVVLNVHGRDSWQGCHVVKQDGKGLSDFLPRLGFLPGQTEAFIFGSLADGVLPSELELKNPCTDSGISSFCAQGDWNLGLSAAALGTSAFPQFAFQEKTRKKPLRLRINAIQMVLFAALALLVLVSGARFYHLMKVSRTYHRNEAAIKELETRFAPLRTKLEKLQALKGLEQDMLDFLHERPSLLEIFKELAEKTPTDAWIKYFTFKNNVLKVSAEGGSAVSTMEAWRKSPLFVSVKLASPVTKDRQGRERYTVELRVRPHPQSGRQ